MTRVLEENYYINAELSWRIKIGEISNPVVQHNDPALFGLKSEEAIKMRIRALRAEKHEFEAEFQEIKGSYLRGERPYAFIVLNSLQAKMDKLSKAISFNYARLRGDITHQPFDLEAIKRVPIDSVVKVNTNGFFQTNPFRAEKEPSNSLYLYRKTNRWTDFGTSQSGDVIDLVMAINQCNFQEACKLLNTTI